MTGNYSMWDPDRRPDDDNPDDPTHQWARGIPQRNSQTPREPSLFRRIIAWFKPSRH